MVFKVIFFVKTRCNNGGVIMVESWTIFQTFAATFASTSPVQDGDENPERSIYTQYSILQWIRTLYSKSFLVEGKLSITKDFCNEGMQLC